jgi:hypothetical protein
MVRLEIDVVLRDTFALVRRDLGLTLSVAGLLFFLPNFIFYGFVPLSASALPETDQSTAVFADLLIHGLLYPMLLIGSFSAVGTVAIIRLWFQPPGETVGTALGYATAMVPVTIALHLAVSAATIGGLVLFLIPGIIISARMLMTGALLADKPHASPAAAWRESWALSRGNGTALFFLAIIIGMMTMLVAFALTMLDGSMAAAADPAQVPQRATLSTGLTNGLVGLIGGMLNAALAASAYRRLATPDMQGIFS